MGGAVTGLGASDVDGVRRTTDRIVPPLRPLHLRSRESPQGLAMEGQAHLRALSHGLLSLAGLRRARALEATDRGAALRQRRRAAAGANQTTTTGSQLPAVSRLDLGAGEGPQGFAMELQTQRRILFHDIHSFFKSPGAIRPARDSREGSYR